MAQIYLPQRAAAQPQQAAQIDWSNPITRALAIAFNPGASTAHELATGRPATVTGTKRVAGVKGIAAGFGSQGQGSSDAIVMPAIAGAVTQRTYFILFNQAGTGGGGLGRLWDCAGSVTGIDACYITGGGTVWQVSVNGTQQNNILTSGVSTGTWNVLICTIDTVAGVAQAYLNGVANYAGSGVGLTATGTLQPSNNPAYCVGNRASDKARNFDGQVAAFDVLNRWVTPAEAASITANLWQLFRTSPRMMPGAAAAPVPNTPKYTLSAASGAFSVAGASAGLTAGRRLAAASAAFTFGAGLANLVAMRRLLAAPGTLSLSAAAAPIIVARRLAAAPGTFTLSGAAAGLRAARRLAAAPAAFAFAGQAATLTYTPAPGPGGPTYMLSAASGSFALSGAAVALAARRKLAAASAAFSLLGAAAGLRVARHLTAAAGSVQVSAAGVTLRVTRRLPALATQFSLDGADVQLQYSAQVSYARAPTGAGYAPRSNYNEARPVAAGSARPTAAAVARPGATQRNNR